MKTMESTFSGVIMEHFRKPRHRRSLDAPTGKAELSNPLCGDRVRIEVRVSESQITDAGFTAEACAICVAAASLLMERIHGGAVESALELDGETVLALLDSTIPGGRLTCALLPYEALRAALSSPVLSAR